jgi:hypothetical protein
MRAAIVALAIVAAAALAAVGSPAPAAASSLVFVKGGDVWLAAPDGSNERQVTTGGYWDSPSQADDGTILAQRATQLYRMNRQGTALAPPIGTIFTGAPSTWAGPVGPVVSPDGVNQAYDGLIVDSPYYDPGCNCYVYVHHYSTFWGSATAFSQPGQTLGQQDYVDPAWIDNSHLLMTSAGILIDQVATYALGGGDNSLVQWFSDPDSSVQSLNDAAITRTAGALAFIANVSGGLGNEIRIYLNPDPAATGQPSDVPVDTCNIGPNPFESLRVSFSPDGQQLVYDAPDGIHLVSLSGLPSCAGLNDHLIIPGGALPSFGPADVGPHDGIQPSGGSGGGSGTGGGGAGGGGSDGGGGNGAGVISVAKLTASGNGTITLSLTATTAGRLTARATAAGGGGRAHSARSHHGTTLRYGSASMAVARAGMVRLTIRPGRAARNALSRAHHLTVAVAITFIPTGGSGHTTRRSITVHWHHR